MKIDHIHFYVEDAKAQANWFIETMGCHRLLSTANADTQMEILRNGAIYFILSSPITSFSPVFKYLTHHPAGVIDIALRVVDIQSILAKATFIYEPLQSFSSLSKSLQWAKIAGWGALTHTLIANTSSLSFCDMIVSRAIAENGSKPLATEPPTKPEASEVDLAAMFTQIDHVVLNVPTGALQQAVDWYCTLFDFQVQQTFKIQTQYSGLNSRVLTSADCNMYFNINEPTSAHSQIQKFLDINRGSGIQHIALRTRNIVQAVANLQQKGLSFLEVPSEYYTQLKQKLTPMLRDLLMSTDLIEIETQHILVDGFEAGSASVLLQIFTQPIFRSTYFFFELIERRQNAQGFGEGNFRALFEAIETEQINHEQSSSSPN